MRNEILKSIKLVIYLKFIYLYKNCWTSLKENLPRSEDQDKFTVRQVLYTTNEITSNCLEKRYVLNDLKCNRRTKFLARPAPVNYNSWLSKEFGTPCRTDVRTDLDLLWQTVKVKAHPEIKSSIPIWYLSQSTTFSFTNYSTHMH